MSFRNTFVTSYIYQASPETIEANKAIKAVFAKNTNLVNKPYKRGYGFYAGYFKTLSGTLEEARQTLDVLATELPKVSKVNFRVLVAIECGQEVMIDVRPASD